MWVVVVDEGLNHLHSRESGFTSVEGEGRLCEDGDARSEVLGTRMGKKSGSSGYGKRVHRQMRDKDLMCFDWNKNRCAVNYASDDETFSVVAESQNLYSEDGDSSSVSGMLFWLMRVAKHPSDEKLGPLPEWSKWECSASQEMW